MTNKVRKASPATSSNTFPRANQRDWTRTAQSRLTKESQKGSWLVGRPISEVVPISASGNQVNTTYRSITHTKDEQTKLFSNIQFVNAAQSEASSELDDTACSSPPSEFPRSTLLSQYQTTTRYNAIAVNKKAEPAELIFSTVFHNPKNAVNAELVDPFETLALQLDQRNEILVHHCM